VIPWRAFILWDADCLRLSASAESRHPLLERQGWFAVLAATLDEDADLWHGLRLLHIGDAFERPLGETLVADSALTGRLQAALEAGEEAIVMLGTPTNRSRKRRDPAYLRGVLHALTLRNKPAVGVPLVAPYTGKAVRVVCEGAREPLKSAVILRPPR